MTNLTPVEAITREIDRRNRLNLLADPIAVAALKLAKAVGELKAHNKVSYHAHGCLCVRCDDRVRLENAVTVAFDNMKDVLRS